MLVDWAVTYSEVNLEVTVTELVNIEVTVTELVNVEVTVTELGQNTGGHSHPNDVTVNIEVTVTDVTTKWRGHSHYKSYIKNYNFHHIIRKKMEYRQTLYKWEILGWSALKER